MKKTKVINRKSVTSDLSIFSPIFGEDKHFITVTEWSNGEGIDVAIDDKSVMSIHYDELEAINFFFFYLQYDT